MSIMSEMSANSVHDAIDAVLHVCHLSMTAFEAKQLLHACCWLTFFAYGDLLISLSALAPLSSASGSNDGPLGSFSPESSHNAAPQTPVLAAAAAKPKCLARKANVRSILNNKQATFTSSVHHFLLLVTSHFRGA